jgi:tetratricopeptide (TPR) repeat protein
MNKCAGKLFTLAVLACGTMAAQAIVDSSTRTSSIAVSARALRYKPARMALKEFNQGLRSLRKGLPQEAAAHFNEAVRISPDFVEALQQLGIAQAAQGETENSLDSFLKASKLEPDSDALRFNVGLTLARLHRMEEAESYARQVVRHAPWFVDGHYLLGIALIAQSKLTAEASASLRRAAATYTEARAALEWMEAQQLERIAKN